jgi:hypothetical protein
LVAFKINSSGIHPKDRKIAAINDCPVQAGTAQSESFLVLPGYDRKFVHQYAHQTTQLYASAADTSAFQWLRKNQGEVNDIQTALSSAPVLVLRDSETDYILRTDALDVAI